MDVRDLQIFLSVAKHLNFKGDAEINGQIEGKLERATRLELATFRLGS